MIDYPSPASRSFVRTFPCAGCGARLSFAPGTRHLKCEYCGTANEIAENDARVEELDFEAFVATLEGREETVEREAVRCDRCGAEQELPEHHFAARCAFCAAPIVGKGYARRHVKPRALVPFQVDRRRAQEAFRRWVRALRLAPAELKRYAQSDAAMTGTYLPFWIYDCRTESEYQGQRGKDHYATNTDPAGRKVRTVKRTDWTPASGRIACVHDDVLVFASHSLAPTLRGASSAWDLRALVPYQPEFVSGYLAEAYQVGLVEGYREARERIDRRVMSLAMREIGGDRQRVDRLDTRYDDVRFRHVLLPVWISAYRYRDKTYRFLVNGQTGEVAGESPLTWLRVGWVVAAVLAFVILLIIVLGV